MDEFVAFYGSDGNVTESGKYSPKVVKTTKIVWTLLHESEDLMLQHGTLDEITAEQNLVQQTYQGMRDQATKTYVVSNVMAEVQLPCVVFCFRFVSSMSEHPSDGVASECCVSADIEPGFLRTQIVGFRTQLCQKRT